MRGPTCVFWAALTPPPLQFSDFVLAGREVLAEPGGGRAKARIQPPPALRAAEGRDPRAVAALYDAWAPAYDETMLDWADLAPAKVWPSAVQSLSADTHLHALDNSYDRMYI